MSHPTDAPPPHPTFSHASPVSAAGFTMIPNVVMLRRDLSPAAKLVYGYMGHLAWIKRADEVEPAQGLIAHDLGIGERTVVEVLKELRRATAAEGDEAEDPVRLIVSKRRGLGLTNAYIINAPLAAAPTEIGHSGTADPAVLEPRKSRLPARARSSSEVKKTTTEEGPPYPPLDQPPPVALLDGRNVALDALLEECLVTNIPENQRAVAAAVILNGRAHRGTGAIIDPGLRHLFWGECRNQAQAQAARATELDENGGFDPDQRTADERLTALHGNPERFATLLADRIRQKAAAYRAAMPGAALTPKSLRDWWFDIEQAPTAAGGFTPDQASRLPDV